MLLRLFPFIHHTIGNKSNLDIFVHLYRVLYATVVEPKVKVHTGARIVALGDPGNTGRNLCMHERQCL